MIHAGADVNSRDHEGRTPLHDAVYYDTLEPDVVADEDIPEESEILDILLKANANPSIKDNKGRTPIDEALRDPFSVPGYKAAKIRTLVTAVNFQEVQHIIPFLTLLKSQIPEKFNVPMPGELQVFLKNTLIEQIVNDKLQEAQKYLPNDSEALLRQRILDNINTALKKAPSISEIPELMEINED